MRTPDQTTPRLMHSIPIKESFKINLVVNNPDLSGIDLSLYNLHQITLLHAMHSKMRPIFYKMITLEPTEWRKISQFRKLFEEIIGKNIGIDPEDGNDILMVTSKFIYIKNEAQLSVTRTSVIKHVREYKKITGKDIRMYQKKNKPQMKEFRVVH